MSKALLSVCMITYNHEHYIEQAINGVLMQITNFPIKLVIGEDFSTDNTRGICLKLAEAHPDKIKLLPSEKNYGVMNNFLRTYNACIGEYIAICEGDDYWTDPYKLQKQVDLLKANSQYSMTCHLGMNMFEVSGIQTLQPFLREEISFKDFASMGPMVHTMSAVFKNFKYVRESINSDWAKRLFGVDLLIFLLLTKDGKKAYCFKDVMGVYRIHNNGIWSSTKFTDRARMAIQNNIAYKQNLALSFRQKMYLNWFMKNGLMSMLYLENKGWRFYFNKLINRGLFVFGPGIFSGLMADLFYFLVKKRWGLTISSGKVAKNS